MVTSKFAKESKSGANKRLQKIINILEEANFHIQILTKDNLKDFVKLGNNYDLGVIVSFSNLKHGAKVRNLCKYWWLDSTDSIFHTRILGLGKNHFLSIAKGIFEITLALKLANDFSIVSYITSSEKKFDNLLFKKTTKFVVPNNPAVFTEFSKMQPKKTLYFISDLNYNANRKALKFLIRELAKIPDHLKCEVDFSVGKYAHNLKPMILSNGLQINFKENIPSEEMYRVGAIHLSPIWNSVGMKNKVLEPSALGVVIIGGTPSFSGLIKYPHMHLVDKKKDFLFKLVELLNSDLPEKLKLFDPVIDDETSNLKNYIKILFN